MLKLRSWPAVGQESSIRSFTERFLRILIWVLPWLVIAVFTYIYIWLGFYNELHLRNGVDLGTYNQLLYNLSSGHSFPPFNSLKNQIAWGDHAHFIVILLTPVYYLFPSYLTVIALQVLAITTSAWALYSIAQKTIRNYIFSYVILFSYLLFFGVQYALNFDFHPNVLTAAILAWSLYALHFRKWLLYWLVFILGLLTREDAATFYVMIGVYLVLFRPSIPFAKRWTGITWDSVKTVGLVTIILAGAYFIGVVYYLMPLWQPDNTALAYFDIPDSARTPLAILYWIAGNPITVIQNMFDTSAKVSTIRNLFQSFGFIPLITPFTYLTILPNFLARFLSGEEQRHMTQFHYGASLVSLLSYGSILTTVLLQRSVKHLWQKVMRQQPVWSSFIISTAVAALIFFGTYTVSLRDIDLPIHRLYDRDFIELKSLPRPARAALDVMRRIIPEEASVSAASGLVPALSSREKIYNFPDGLETSVDWIVLSDEGNTWPYHNAEMKTAIKELRLNSDYILSFDNYGIVAFKKR